MQIIPTYKLPDGTWVEFSYLQYTILKCKDEYRTPIGNPYANTKHIQAQAWIHRVLPKKAPIRLWGIRQ